MARGDGVTKTSPGRSATKTPQFNCSTLKEFLNKTYQLRGGATTAHAVHFSWCAGQSSR